MSGELVINQQPGMNDKRSGRSSINA